MTTVREFALRTLVRVAVIVAGTVALARPFQGAAAICGGHHVFRSRLDAQGDVAAYGDDSTCGECGGLPCRIEARPGSAEQLDMLSGCTEDGTWLHLFLVPQ